MFRYLPPLLILLLAPACAPEAPPSPPAKSVAVVLLTDTTQWPAGELTMFRDSLETSNHRLVVSGYPGETPTDLVARLPWLLQPGTEKIIYDPRLAGPAADSLRAAIERLGRTVDVVKR